MLDDCKDTIEALQTRVKDLSRLFILRQQMIDRKERKNEPVNVMDFSYRLKRLANLAEEVDSKLTKAQRIKYKE